ncbi:hypothetical protein S83_058256 [Arachis hypogaea]
MQHTNLSQALNSHPSLSSTQILNVCLLYEVGKGKASRWYPYLMHLPKSYDILAMFGEFEKTALQVQFLLEVLVCLVRLDIASDLILLISISFALLFLKPSFMYLVVFRWMRLYG